MTAACTRACWPLPWPASPPRIGGETASRLGPWTSARVAWEGGRVVGEMPGGIAVRDGGGSLRAAGLRNGSDDPEYRRGHGGPGRPCVASEHAASPSTEGPGRAGRVPSGVAMDAEKEGTLHFEGDPETGISAHRFPPGEKPRLRMRCSGPRRSQAASGHVSSCRRAQALCSGGGSLRGTCGWARVRPPPPGGPLRPSSHLRPRPLALLPFPCAVSPAAPRAPSPCVRLLPAVRPAQALGAGVLLCSPSSPQSLA